VPAWVPVVRLPLVLSTHDPAIRDGFWADALNRCSDIQAEAGADCGI
jgi:hypothetical protein